MSRSRWTDKAEHLETAIPGLTLWRRIEPTEPAGACTSAQGTKRVVLGDDVYVYDAHHFLITSVDLPAVWQVVEASREYSRFFGAPPLRDVNKLRDLPAAE